MFIVFPVLICLAALFLARLPPIDSKPGGGV